MAPQPIDDRALRKSRPTPSAGNRISHQVIVQLIGATTTQTGLTVRCEIDANRYPKGIKVTAAEMATLAIERDPFHGEGNYTISPNQQPP
jgi:hypothetical protein